MFKSIFCSFFVSCFFFGVFFFFIHALFIFFVFKMFIWKIWVFISDSLWRNKLAWSISNFAELFNWIALIIIWIDFTLKGYIGKEKTTHLYKTFFFSYTKNFYVKYSFFTCWFPIGIELWFNLSSMLFVFFDIMENGELVSHNMSKGDWKY